MARFQQLFNKVSNNALRRLGYLDRVQGFRALKTRFQFKRLNTAWNEFKTIVKNLCNVSKQRNRLETHKTTAVCKQKHPVRNFGYSFNIEACSQL